MASRCAASFFRAVPQSTSIRSAGRAIVELSELPNRHSPAFSSRCLATAAPNPTSTSTKPPEPSLPPPPLPPLPLVSTTATDPKVGELVDRISGLTLLQAADLVSLLKSRLNIQEMALPTAGVPLAASAAPAAEAAVEEEKPKAKTIFNVTLASFDATAKPKVIREVKALVPNLTLIDAKKFVESLPKVLKENLTKEEADKLKATFEGVGAVVNLD